jgi:hypothetical protein
MCTASLLSASTPWWVTEFDPLAFFVNFINRQGHSLKTAACCTKSSRSPVFRFFLFHFAFSSNLLSFFLFDKQSPPSSQWITTACQHILNYLININPSTAHTFQSFFLQKRCKWRWLLEL